MANAPLPNLQQHEPFRIPQGWGRQERVLISQLEQVFDDLYRRFGRIRLEDLATGVQADIKESTEGVQEVRQEIAGVQDDLTTNYSTHTQTASEISDAVAAINSNLTTNYSTRTQTADAITAAVANTYGKVNQVSITTDGVAISGTGKLDVHMANFDVNGSTGAVTIKGALTANTGSSLGNWEVTSAGYLRGKEVSSGGSASRFPIYLNPNPRTDPTTMLPGNMALWGGVEDSTAMESNAGAFWISKGATIGCNTLQYINTPSQRSSRDVKHDIKPIEPCGDRLDQLTPVSFKYNIDPDGPTHYGLIYEDTVEAMPEICNETDAGTKVISYIDMIPFLLKEIQDLRARVAQLEAKEVT